MTPQDVRTTRAFLDLTPEQLASELDVTPDVILAWERGDATPSRYHARVLEWHRAVRERQRLMDAQGLAECPTARQLLDEFMKAPGAGTRQHAAVQAHLAACPTCIAVGDFERTLPPLPDYPLGLVNRAFVAMSERISQFPPWARPAAWGALLVGSLVSLRAVAFLLFGAFSWRVLTLAALGFLVGAYLGAVGGVVYHFVRPRTRHLRRWGAYLTGIACAAGYLLAFMIPAALIGEGIARDPAGWVIASVSAVMFGLIIGHVMFREL